MTETTFAFPSDPAVHMDPVPKALLCHALRSGQYGQTVDALRVADDFCVMGLMCEVFRLATGRGHWAALREDGGSVAFVLEEWLDCGEPPTEVIEWFGLVTGTGEYAYNPALDGKPMSVWNDSYRTAFPTFATMIERGL